MLGGEFVNERLDEPAEAATIRDWWADIAAHIAGQRSAA